MNRPTVYLRALVCIACSGLSLTAQSQTAAVRTAPRVPAPVAIAYSADVENVQGARVSRSQILYDHGRFRIGIWYLPSQWAKPPDYFEIYDATVSPVMWEYQSSRRVAAPSRESLQNALEDAKARYGEEVVRRRYDIPPAAPSGVVFHGSEALRPAFQILAAAGLPPYRWRKVGAEPVAGVRCDVLEAVRPTVATKPNRPDAARSDEAPSARAWVDPGSRLVLRLEERIAPQGGSMPPTRAGYRVTRFQRLSHAPRQAFSLPRGTTAALPETLWNTNLPPGVSRMHMNGRARQVGVDYASAYGGGAPAAHQPYAVRK